jgi:hypothetical protein
VEFIPVHVAFNWQVPFDGLHIVVFDRNPSEGHVELFPVHVELAAHGPAPGLHIVPLGKNTGSGHCELFPVQNDASLHSISAKHSVVFGKYFVRGQVQLIPL